MEPRFPKYMSDEGRVDYALDLLEEAFSALCYIGTDVYPPVRPDRVQKAINRIDKAMNALEHQSGQ
jgi:hypothetical protein